MRFPLLLVIILLVFSGLIDLYIYRAIVKRCKQKIWRKVQLCAAIIMALILISIIILPKRGGSNDTLVCVMWLIYAYLSIYIPKIIFIIFDFIAKLPELWKGKRWKIVTRSGAVIAVASSLLMWWGALINRYSIDIVEQTVEIDDLPASFDGLKIAQISDLHVGSYGNNSSFPQKLVEEVNKLHPDAIVFTGDIVNRRTEEIEPFISALSQLKAPYGVYSIMGNHDYGDYSAWDSDEAKQQNVADLKRIQSQMGWTMLNNATHWLKIGNDSIALIGVENVGDPPFKTYGNLSEAYKNIGDSNTKILLTHNPAHWTSDICDKENSNIALTLSGHTHAMQIEIFGWSPAMWRYPTWGGMYHDDKGQRLYVNIGAGEVGFPARIGATPEITLFTLKSKIGI